MNQIPLIHEDIFEALRTDVMALGGFKKLGLTIWPDKPMDQASILLSNCLNRTRAEKLDPEQIQFIIREARKIHSFATITFMLNDAGFAPPQPIEPEDEKAALQRQFIEATKMLGQLAKQLERHGIKVVA